MAPLQDFEIVRWSNPAQVPEISALLRAAYAPLAKAGLRYLATYQDDTTTLDRLSEGESYLALDEGKIIGTIALSLPGQLTHCALFRRPEVSVFHQFGVLPPFQGKGVGGALLAHIEDRARALGATQLACDTAKSASHLIAMYERKGFALAGHADWDVTNYRSVLLLKPITPTT